MAVTFDQLTATIVEQAVEILLLRNELAKLTGQLKVATTANSEPARNNEPTVNGTDPTADQVAGAAAGGGSATPPDGS